MSATVGTRFGLRLPEDWVEFDVRRALRTGDLTRAVDERIAHAPALRPHRSVLLKALRKLAEDADQRGAVYCAAAAEPSDEDGHLLASLTAFVTEGMPEPALNTVEAIAVQIPTVPAGDDGPDWREVRIVTLEAGRAVRVRGVSTQESTDGARRLSMVVMQTLLPVPGTERVLDLVLTSPQIALAEPLLDPFDAISSTLTWEAGPPVR